MTKALSEILGFGQPATPMTPAEKAAEREQKKKEREKAKEQQAATREKRKEELDNKRAAEKKAKEERHDARIEKRGNRQVELARQNASGARIRARAASKRQLVTGKGTTTSATKLNRARVDLANAKNASSYKKAATSARIHAMRKKINLQKSMMNQSTEYDMSTVEIISESCMVGLNEDMYFKVKIEGLPTMYVNSANREELRKDLVGLLRNPSKAVGDIKRVTPQEVKKRLRLRSQGKEEEEMNEAQINKMKFVSTGFTGRKEAERHNDHLVGSGKASPYSYVHNHKDGKFYVVDAKAKVLQSSTNVSEATADVINKLKEYYTNESITRNKIANAMDRSSGRNQDDRIKDATKASKARQDSEKDLTNFRKKNAKVLQSSIDEVTASDVTAAYQRAMIHPEGSLQRREAMDHYNSVRIRHKNNPIDVGEATADVINKLKEYYTNESKAYYAPDADGKKMSKSTKEKRTAHFAGGGSYKPAPGDATAKTKPSKHTKKADEMGMGPTDEACWKGYKQVGMKKKGKKMVPNCVPENTSYNINENKKGLQNKAEKSGMPLGVLKQVYNRGMAAWKTGHRPGTTPEQWGMARVNSFITKSSGTWGKADKDLAAKVRK